MVFGSPSQGLRDGITDWMEDSLPAVLSAPGDARPNLGSMDVIRFGAFSESKSLSFYSFYVTVRRVAEFFQHRDA